MQFENDFSEFVKHAEVLSARECACAGEALATALGHGRVGVAFRPGELSNACADAVSAGLRASGVDVWNFGVLFESQLSFLVPFCSLKAGVFISADEGTVSVFGENGLSISTALSEKAAELMHSKINSFALCGRAFDMSAMTMLYADELSHRLPRCVTDCAVLSSNPLITALTDDRMRITGSEKQLVFRINRWGTSLTAYSEKTGVVPFVKLVALCGMHELENGSDISVPYDAPAFLDELARNCGRTAYRYLSAPSDGSDNIARRLAARQFWSRDALFTAAKIMSVMEEKSADFATLYEKLPPFFVYSTVAKLEVPPEYLSEFEGEKFSFDRDGGNGFVLVEKRGKAHISPVSQDRVRLTVQSVNEETAQELCADIKRILSENRTMSKPCETVDFP